MPLLSGFEAGVFLCAGAGVCRLPYHFTFTLLAAVASCLLVVTMEAQANVEHEIRLLSAHIQRLGHAQPDGSVDVTFAV